MRANPRIYFSGQICGVEGYVEAIATGLFAGLAAVQEVTFTFSDFRVVGGVQLPHTIVRRVGPMQATWTITSWEVNPTFQPADFAPVRR